MFRKAVALTLLALVISITSKAQESNESVDKSFYLPTFLGGVKGLFEMSTIDGEYRFAVSNARLGFRGNVSKNMRYFTQVDFNADGRFQILDANVTYQPLKWLNVTMGQTLHHFSVETQRGPTLTDYAHNSFITQYLLNYYTKGDDGVISQGSVGTRDIGAVFQANYRWHTQMRTIFGLLNGTGINNAPWSKTMDYLIRQEIGSLEGLRVSGAWLTGKIQNKFHINMWTIEARYKHKEFLFEGSVAQNSIDTYERQCATVLLAQAQYRCLLPKNPLCKYVMPLIRYDYGDDIRYNKTDNMSDELVDLQRISCGVNFLMTERLKPFQAEIRFQYEHYFMNDKPMDYATQKQFHNKFCVEFVAAF
ncbi:MAG: hypothetical protein ACRC6R_09310 [Bacteroidales bacterium]